MMRGIFRTQQPIPRAGLPDDIAQAAVFLASDESSGRNWSQQQQRHVALRQALGQRAE